MKDPQLMDLSLRRKLVWNLVNNSQSWWKSALIRKYHGGRRPVRLEDLMSRNKCTHI